MTLRRRDDFGLSRQNIHDFKHRPNAMPKQMMIIWMFTGRALLPETRYKEENSYYSVGYGNKMMIIVLYYLLLCLVYSSVFWCFTLLHDRKKGKNCNNNG